MLKDMIGFENRYFKVVEFLEYKTNDNGKRRRYWRCLCRCGNEKILSTTELSTSRPLSCGCHVKVGVGNRTNHSYLVKHGLSGRKNKHPVYKLWMRIRSRCYSTTFPRDVRNYKDRGIVMCDDWRDNPRLFYDWCISNGWKEGLSIDRIDNNGNYEPNNCQFLTISENSKKLWRDRPNLNRGSNSKNTNINEEIVKKTRELLRDGLRQYEVARIMELTKNQIHQIKSNKTWKHVKI